MGGEQGKEVTNVVSSKYGRCKTLRSQSFSPVWPILLVILSLIACGNSGPDDVVMQNQLPTLTPTVDGVVAQPPTPDSTETTETKNIEKSVPTEENQPEAERETSSDAQNSSLDLPNNGTGHIVIVDVNRVDDYVDIRNMSEEPINMTDWKLESDRREQTCILEGVLQPNEQLRIWALVVANEKEGHNCGIVDDNYWPNTNSDIAILYDSSGTEMSRMVLPDVSN